MKELSLSDHILNRLCEEKNKYTRSFKHIIDLILELRKEGHSVLKIIQEGDRYLVDKNLFLELNNEEEKEYSIKKVEEIINSREILAELKKLEFIHVDENMEFISFIGDKCLEEKVYTLIKNITGKEKNTFVEAREVSEEIINSFLNNRFSVITGGPGTGKTYSCKKIIEKFLEKEEGTIGIAAPTGKAVDVVKDAICSSIKSDRLFFNTIHSLLSIKLGISENVVVRKVGFDLLIIDESSMLSTKNLFKILLSMNSDTKVIFVGDSDQLPSIECGSIFDSLCKVDMGINVVKLVCNKRAENNAIVDASSRIVNEETDIDCVEFLNRNKAYEALKLLIGKLNLNEWIICDSDNQEEKFKSILEKINDTKIISISNQEFMGVDFINYYIKSALEKLALELKAVGYVMPGIAALNQKAIGLSNGTAILIFNKLSSSEENEIVYEINSKTQRINQNLVRGTKVAWALTVHKSQGSAYNDVFFFVNLHKRCTKLHLYTAVTRARQSIKVYVINDEEDDSVLEDIYKRKGIRYSSINLKKY